MKKILITTCTSFTGVILLVSLFSRFGMVPTVNSTFTLQTFILTLSIAVGMSLTEKIENKIWIPRALTSYVLIFVEGGLFGWFEYSIRALLLIVPIWLPVFLFTYLVVYLTCVEYADSINKSIKKKK